MVSSYLIEIKKKIFFLHYKYNFYNLKFLIKQSQTKMKIDYLKIYVYQQVVKHLQSGQYFPKAIDIKQRRGSMPSLCTCTLQRG